MVRRRPCSPMSPRTFAGSFTCRNRRLVESGRHGSTVQQCPPAALTPTEDQPIRIERHRTSGQRQALLGALAVFAQGGHRDGRDGDAAPARPSSWPGWATPVRSPRCATSTPPRTGIEPSPPRSRDWPARPPSSRSPAPRAMAARWSSRNLPPGRKNGPRERAFNQPFHPSSPKGIRTRASTLRG
jgi:hypothetical protein